MALRAPVAGNGALSGAWTGDPEGLLSARGLLCARALCPWVTAVNKGW